jgi:hypothetical protein
MPPSASSTPSPSGAPIIVSMWLLSAWLGAILRRRTPAASASRRPPSRPRASLLAAGGRAVLVMPEGERPHIRFSDGRGIRLEDAGDDNALGKQSETAANLAQMRWKTSVPRTLATRPFGATYVAIPLVTRVVELTKRPDQTVVALQSVVQFLEVWNTTRGPRTRPTRS